MLAARQGTRLKCLSISSINCHEIFYKHPVLSCNVSCCFFPLPAPVVYHLRASIKGLDNRTPVASANVTMQTFQMSVNTREHYSCLTSACKHWHCEHFSMPIAPSAEICAEVQLHKAVSIAAVQTGFNPTRVAKSAKSINAPRCLLCLLL